ncbi:MAG: hypothetical protein K9H18_22940, partial [Rhodospirillum sp.]|nr:hypothetical protein [Rhodospirillum sp.]
MTIAPPISTAPSEHEAAAILLRWYLDAGVDVGIGEAPLDRYALTAAARDRARGDTRRDRAAGGPRPGRRGRASGSTGTAP